MKKNISLHAWLLALCLGTAGIMVAPEIRESIHENRTETHTELEDRQAAEKKAQEEKHAQEKAKVTDELSKIKYKDERVKSGSKDVNNVKKAIKDVTGKDIKLDPPKNSKDLKEQKEKIHTDLKEQHEAAKKELAEQHAKETATADSLADAFSSSMSDSGSAASTEPEIASEIQVKSMSDITTSEQPFADQQTELLAETESLPDTPEAKTLEEAVKKAETPEELKEAVQEFTETAKKAQKEKLTPREEALKRKEAERKKKADDQAARDKEQADKQQNAQDKVDKANKQKKEEKAKSKEETKKRREAKEKEKAERQAKEEIEKVIKDNTQSTDSKSDYDAKQLNGMREELKGYVKDYDHLSNDEKATILDKLDKAQTPGEFEQIIEEAQKLDIEKGKQKAQEDKPMTPEEQESTAQNLVDETNAAIENQSPDSIDNLVKRSQDLVDNLDRNDQNEFKSLMSEKEEPNFLEKLLAWLKNIIAKLQSRK